jgi:ABC-2 type transport system ATP-binding protein
VTELNVLEARALGKRHGDQWALRDCTLALPSGRVVGLVGPNGAGKTTLLQLAVGVLAPTTGEISVFGRDPREMKSVLPRVGFVAQDSPLYRSFTVGDTLSAARHLNLHFDERWAVSGCAS